MRRLSTLLSAYACEPGKSSEQGVGWKWALHLSQFCDVTVVTRSNNREAIEAAFKTDPAASRIRWIYHDLGQAALSLKRRFGAHRIYYQVWQRSLRVVLPKLLETESYDVIHHFTFASYRYSTAISNLPGTKIWGPVGGAEFTPWHLLPWDHFPTFLHEVARNLQMFRIGGAKEASKFSHIFTSTIETQTLLEGFGYSTTLMPTIGIEQHALPPEVPRIPRQGGLRLLFVGNLQYLKGIHFVIEALARLPQTTTFSIVGSGAYEKRLKKLACRFHVSAQVEFLGYVSPEKIASLHLEHDIFIFPSLHDSGGIALLEAMASGMGSIVLDCGGPKVITNSSCSIQVPVGSHEEIVEGIAVGIQKFLDDPETLQSRGRAARERIIKNFLWENKAEKMVDFYRELLESNNP